MSKTTGKWRVFFHPTPIAPIPQGLSDWQVKLVVDARSRIRREGIPFLLDPDGRPDDIINSFFTGSGRGARLARTSARTYAFDIATFCNVLSAFGSHWRIASGEDVAAVREWRLHDPRNSRRVTDSTWQRQYDAVSSLYRWAARHGIENPLPAMYDVRGNRVADGGGSYVRSSSVKWFTGAAFKSWADVGLAGLLPDGSESSAFRGRNSQRDVAFATGLYRTGLRVQELGSLLTATEWPEANDGRKYHSKWLPQTIAKGRYGRRYWVPASAISQTVAYSIGERARAIRLARSRGTYDQIPSRLIVERADSERISWVDANGSAGSASLESLSFEDRRRLFRRMPAGLEPAMLWLTEDGLPMDHARWDAIFSRANKRISELGIDFPRLKPHHLRHSFALRWFAVGRLLWLGRTSLLTASESRQLRDEMGSQWFLVQTLLGHRTVETTRGVYLEPFAGLDVELLIAAANDESASELLRFFLDDNPRVTTEVLR